VQSGVDVDVSGPVDGSEWFVGFVGDRPDGLFVLAGQAEGFGRE
jgi:hypothetical protein